MLLPGFLLGPPEAATSDRPEVHSDHQDFVILTALASPSASGILTGASRLALKGASTSLHRTAQL